MQRYIICTTPKQYGFWFIQTVPSLVKSDTDVLPSWVLYIMILFSSIVLKWCYKLPKLFFLCLSWRNCCKDEFFFPKKTTVRDKTQRLFKCKQFLIWPSFRLYFCPFREIIRNKIVRFNGISRDF
jgi:hypothetical protein